MSRLNNCVVCFHMNHDIKQRIFVAQVNLSVLAAAQTKVAIDRRAQCAQFPLLRVENRAELRKRHRFEFFDGSDHKDFLNSREFCQKCVFSKFLLHGPALQDPVAHAPPLTARPMCF